MPTLCLCLLMLSCTCCFCKSEMLSAPVSSKYCRAVFADCRSAGREPGTFTATHPKGCQAWLELQMVRAATSSQGLRWSCCKLPDKRELPLSAAIPEASAESMQPFQPFSRSCSLALGFRALGWRSLLGGRVPSGDLHPWVTPLAAGLPAGAALLGLGMRVPDIAGDLHILQDDHHIGGTPNGGYSSRCL